jgi:Flp pilus assembly protein TadG
MYATSSSSRRRRGRRRGAAAAELALILPLLITLVLAAVDFGRFVSLYIALANAARSGAQYGAMNNFSSSTQTAWTNNVKAAAVDEISGQYSGFSSSNVTVTPNTTRDANGLRNVTVTATYQFTTLINWQWTGLGLPHTFNVSQQAEVPLIR